MKTFNELAGNERPAPPTPTVGWGLLTLGEICLIKLGLEVIGEENRVDPSLMNDYVRLRREVGHELDTRFPAPPSASQEGSR